jgi:hypothetical protein
MAAILQQGCVIQCPHGGMVNPIPANVRVRVGGGFALLATDVFIVAGCPFTVGPKPQPCITVEWQAPTQRVQVNGQTVLLATSIGLCKSAEQVVQGVAIVSAAQPRVQGV